MIGSRLLCVVLALTLPAPAAATDYYASPAGTPSGDGSITCAQMPVFLAKTFALQ